MSIFSRTCVLVVGLSLGVVAFPAQAQKEAKISKEEATKRFNEASQQYKLQEYDLALENFKELYRLTGEAVFLYNIAQCNRQLNHMEEALKGYKLFLQEAPNSELKQNAETRVTELEASISQKKADAEKAEQEKRAAEIAALQDAANQNTRPFFLTAAVAGGSGVLVGGAGVTFGQLSKRSAAKATSIDDPKLKSANTFKNLSTPFAVTGDIFVGIAAASAVTALIIKKKSAHPETVQVAVAPWGGELVVRF
jgi:tetratricopeptide (TPR) repeat protein